MADQRSISGTIATTSLDGKATVGAKMAYDLWVAEHGDSPKMSDWQYLELVKTCIEALSGKSPYGSNFQKKIAEIV